MNTTVYRCSKCDRMFPDQHIAGCKCPICQGTMNDVTGTQLAKDFLAIVKAPVPRQVKFSFMDRRISTDYGNDQA